MRIFVGVELDERVKQAAARVADTLKGRLARASEGLDARWIAPENLHITVWFIGEAADDRAEAIAHALQPELPGPAFDLAIGGCGAFPPAGAPRVLWLGVRRGLDDMRRVYAAVQERFAPLGLEGERRPYSPHVTIARVKAPGRGRPRAIRDALAGVDADCGACRVAAVTLFRSRLSPRGAAYEPLLRVPLC